MANPDGESMKMPRHLLRWCLACLLLLLLALGYDYFHSLRVLQASVVGVLHDPAKPDRRVLRIGLLTDYPEWVWVPDRVRAFFSNSPILCFLDADGTELMNDDLQSPCLSLDEALHRPRGSHHMEQTTFDVPVYLQPSRFNGKQHFLRRLRQQKGLWLQFRLGGYIFPPTISSQPVFVDFALYCAKHPEACGGLLGQ